MASKKRKKPKVPKHATERPSAEIFSASPKGKASKNKPIKTTLVQNWKYLAIAVLIVMVAFLLRLYRIGEQELWLDEAFSFHIATMPNWVGSLLTDTNPPLYYLLLRVWVQVAGQSEAAIRLFSAVLGTLFVIAVIWAGKEFFKPCVGLWSGWFGATAPLHIYYSQEARTYTLLSLALLLTYIMVWRALKKDTLKSWTLVSASALVALYSHYFAILGLLAAAFLFVIWPEKQQIKQLWLRFGGAVFLSGLLFLPWLFLSFVFTPHSSAGTAWIQDVWERIPPLLAIPRSLEVFGLGSQAGLLPITMKQFNYLEFPSSLRHLGLAIILLLGIWVAVPCGEKQLTLAWLAKRKAWLWTLLFFPLVALWLASLYKPVYVVGRYDMVAFPAYVILLGLALAKVQSAGRPILATFVAFILFIPVGTKLFLYYQAPSIPDAQPTARVIHNVVNDGDVVVFTGLRGLPFLYYVHRLGYQWSKGYCDNQVNGKRFGCRMFPRETERTPAAYDAYRVLNSPEAVREDMQDFMAMLRSPRSVLWVVFDSSDYYMGQLTVPKPDSFLVEELKRLGLYPSRLVIDEAPGIFRFEGPMK